MTAKYSEHFANLNYMRTALPAQSPIQKVNREHVKFVEHLQSFISVSSASRLVLVFTNTKIKTNRSTIVLVV